MGKKKNRSRLTKTDFNKVLEMQRDLCYLKQFVVNVPALFMGLKPTMLVTTMCSDDVKMLTQKCWNECMKATEKLGIKTE